MKETKKHHSSSRHKHKKNKKHKKHREKRSSSRDSDSSYEMEWVEAPAPKLEPTCNKREEWMNEELFVSTLTKEEMRLVSTSSRERKLESKMQELKKEEEIKQQRELNPHWKNSGSGLPVKEESNVENLHLPSTCVGDGGYAYLKKAYIRIQEQAQREGRSMEEVAVERWGSLSKLKSMLKAAEERMETLAQDRYKPTQSRHRDERNRASSSKSFKKPSNCSRSPSPEHVYRYRKPKDYDLNKKNNLFVSSSHRKSSSYTDVKFISEEDKNSSYHSRAVKLEKDCMAWERTSSSLSSNSCVPAWKKVKSENDCQKVQSGPFIDEKDSRYLKKVNDFVSARFSDLEKREIKEEGVQDVPVLREKSPFIDEKDMQYLDKDNDFVSARFSDLEKREIKEEGVQDVPLLRKKNPFIDEKDLQDITEFNSFVTKKFSAMLEREFGEALPDISLLREKMPVIDEKEYSRFLKKVDEFVSPRFRELEKRKIKEEEVQDVRFMREKSPFIDEKYSRYLKKVNDFVSPRFNDLEKREIKEEGVQDVPLLRKKNNPSHERHRHDRNARDSIEKKRKSSEIVQSEDDLNRLAAKHFKAMLSGDIAEAELLKEKLNEARKNFKAEGSKKMAPVREKEKVLLTKMDSSGQQRPIQSSREEIGFERQSKHKRSNKYFDDTSRYSLKQMFEREKLTTADDNIEMFLDVAAQCDDRTVENDNETSGISKKASQKMAHSFQEEKDIGKAVRQHQKMNLALEKCEYCMDQPNMKRHLIVSISDQVYLCIPNYQSLTEHHCLIVPKRHVPSFLALEEDEWNEVEELKNLLRHFFKKQDKRLICLETSMSFQRCPHTVLECIPVPLEEGDMAPLYFKKALLESEEEWTHNIKLIDLTKKGLRRSIPKNLPYFCVTFDPSVHAGYAHVIEDEKYFPRNFGKEVIGGMLDIDYNYLYKNRREDPLKKSKEALDLTRLLDDFKETVK